MADTRGTGIVQGRLEIVGLVHGAINTIITLYGTADFEFKQFVTQEQLEQYAYDNFLEIVSKEKR